jgi:hypothetical protein
VNPIIQALLHLVIDLRAKPGQAAERSLDVAAGAAKPVVEIKVAESGIEVITPHQADDPPAQPDAFRVARRAVDNLSRFGEFVCFALAVPGRVRRIGRGFAGSILGGRRSTLSDGGANADHKCQPGDGEETQDRNLKLKHPLTHKFPELVPAHVFPQPMPFK